MPYKNYPFDEIAFVVGYLATKGWNCYQKFSCEKCGARLGMDTPNVLYKTGSCDKCGHVSDIEKSGCNYLATARGRSLYDLIRDQAEAEKVFSPKPIRKPL